ncbi:MAG: GPR endopeptidase, partial [Lachnospiraceae bacterium]
VKGIVEQTSPTLVIAIDALAARSSKRLGCTIQIADTGIHPGSGVGNHRCGLNRETLGIPVIALGVPTVVDAASICYDVCHDPDQIPQELAGMFVTPKNIDEIIRNLSCVISEALNLAFEL